MSAYPPPPVPPPGAPAMPPYGPYDRRALNAAAKAQRRAMRQQARYQARMLRRRSLVGPLLILGLGIVFLLVQAGKLTWVSFFGWYSRWWPLVLIGAGAFLLAEWMLGRREFDDGTPRPRVTLGGGVIFLLILLAISGASTAFVFKMDLLARRGLGMDFSGIASAIGERHDEDTTLNSGIEPTETLLVRVPRGDVNITGTSDDGQVHVSVHKEVHTWIGSAAESKLQAIQPVFSHHNGVLNLDVPELAGGRASLTIQVPPAAGVTVNADRGDIIIGQLHGTVSVSGSDGEINLDGVTGMVSAHVGGARTSFTAHSVTGGVKLEGRCNDVAISDVMGPVDLEGTFYGQTHIEHVNGAVGFHSNRTQFDAARLDGELNLEGGEDLEAEALLGPVTLKTAYKNVRLDRVQGDMHVVNRDGAVTVTHTSPMSAIDIQNKGGSVDLGLPENAAFDLDAQTHDGDIETDYGLQSHGGEDVNKTTGKVAGGGPLVRIVTDNGDVTVRKSATVPLPPVAPAPPKITMAPVAPAPPVKSAPKAPKAPVAPAAPSQPWT